MLRMKPDSMDVEVAWQRVGENERQTEALHSMISTPVVGENYIYGVDSYGELRCLEAGSGKRIWEDLSAVPKARWSNIHFVTNGDRVWMFNERGELILAAEHQEKFSRGPRGLVQMLPVPSMGKNLGLTMLFFLVCNATFAYLAEFALSPGDVFIKVFRFVATIALLTFCASILQHSIWFKNRVTGHIIESIGYALIAGAIFAGLWPAG